MTFTIPGEEPVGYTFRAENYDRATMAAKLPEMMLEADGMFLTAENIEDQIRYLALMTGVEYDDLRSYDSDDFPKPIYEDQLSCSDLGWSELAPDHVYEFIPRGDGVRHCRVCGGEEPPY